jgi:hypothetical protein
MPCSRPFPAPAVRGRCALRTSKRSQALPRLTSMSLLANVRHSTRGLRKTPVFAISCIVVLALAIGATTAIFGLVDAALIRPLPFPASDRLVMLWERTPAYARGFVAPLNFIDWSEQSHSFAAMAATLGATPSSLVTNGGVTEAINVSTVTAGFFDVLGVTPIAGRTFTSADATDGASIVISERLWRCCSRPLASSRC